MNEQMLTKEERQLSEECRVLAAPVYGKNAAIIVDQVAGSDHYEAEVVEVPEVPFGETEAATARPNFGRVGASKVQALTLLRDALKKQAR